MYSHQIDKGQTYSYILCVNLDRLWWPVVWSNTNLAGAMKVFCRGDEHIQMSINSSYIIALV